MLKFNFGVVTQARNLHINNCPRTKKHNHVISVTQGNFFPQSPFDAIEEETTKLQINLTLKFRNAFFVEHCGIKTAVIKSEANSKKREP